jgi:hypothetical protein
MKVLICGLGAIGSNLLVAMVRRWPDFQYFGLDHDRVEERNMRTQAYFLEMVNQPKAMAMRAVLARYSRKVSYTPIDLTLTKHIDTMNMDYDLIIDCFDNSLSRKFLDTEKTWHLGFSPFYTAEAIWNKNYEFPGDVDQQHADICAVDNASFFINFFVNVALMELAESFETLKKRDFILNKTVVKYL